MPRVEADGMAMGSGGAGVARGRTAVPERPRFDPLLLAAMFALVVLGIVMVYSSSAHFAGLRHGDAAYFLKRQGVAALVGLVAVSAILRLGYRRLAPLAIPLLVLSGLMLLATYTPLGLTAGGAQRWIRFPGFQLQPSEFAKLGLLVWLARSAAQRGEQMRSFRSGILPHLIVFFVFAAMVLPQPDLGTVIVLGAAVFAVLFVAGAPIAPVLAIVAALVPVAIWFVVSTPYRMRRIQAFLDPFADRFGAGYQVAEALMSLGSGGVFGLGLGDGRQKLGYLPAGHTDYILASIGEELGLVGVGLTLGLFAVLIHRGWKAALNASDAFGAFLAFGLTSLLAVEAVVNAGMCLGLLPSKGLALPFVSYGGTSLLTSMIAAGILLSISADRGGFLSPATGALRCSS